MKQLTHEQRAAVRADRLARQRREREQRAAVLADIAQHAGTCGRRDCLTCKAFALLAEYVPFEPTIREEQEHATEQLDELRERLERIRDVHKTISDAARIGTPLARTVHDAAWVATVRLANAWYGEDVEDPYAPLQPDYLTCPTPPRRPRSPQAPGSPLKECHMKTITVEYNDVTTATIEHRPTEQETVLSMGNRRYPVALTDKGRLLEALHIADKLSAAVVGWRGDIVAALQKLDADQYARENSTV